MKQPRRDAAPHVADDVADGPSAAEEPPLSLRCVSCRAPVTTPEQRTEIAGRHNHTCLNPAGVVYRIGCYDDAPGCAGSGGFSHDDSWFAGYAWQIGCCRRCATHLGWLFRSDADKPGFAGLIVERLVEG